LPLYAVGFTGDPPQAAAQAADALTRGYHAVKVRIGLDPQLDAQTLQQTRRAIGDAPLLIDANMAFDRDGARRAALAAQDVLAAWLEEPLPPHDVAGLAELRDASPVPIAAGENAFTAAQGEHLVDAAAVDVVMPDLGRCGGYSAARRIARAAAAVGLTYSPHHYGSDIGLAAALHLCAAEPGARWMLHDVSAWPLRTAVVHDPVLIKDGEATIPSGPDSAWR